MIFRKKERNKIEIQQEKSISDEANSENSGNKKVKKIKKIKKHPIKALADEFKKIEWCEIKELFLYSLLSIVIACIMALILYGLNCLSAEIVNLVKGVF